MTEVKTIYCMPCGYFGRAQTLKKQIEENVKGTKVVLEGGHGGVMDIFVDGKLIFSKHQVGRFPEPKEILEKVT